MTEHSALSCINTVSLPDRVDNIHIVRNSPADAWQLFVDQLMHSCKVLRILVLIVLARRTTETKHWNCFSLISVFFNTRINETINIECFVSGICGRLKSAVIDWNEARTVSSLFYSTFISRRATGFKLPSTSSLIPTGQLYNHGAFLRSLLYFFIGTYVSSNHFITLRHACHLSFTSPATLESSPLPSTHEPYIVHRFWDVSIFWLQLRLEMLQD